MHEASRVAAGVKGSAGRLRDSVGRRLSSIVGEAATSVSGPDEKRRARILAFLNAAIFLAGLAFIIVDGWEWLVNDQPHAAYNTLTSVAFCAIVAISWELSRRGLVTLAGVVHVALTSVGLIAFFRFTAPGTMNIIFVESVIVAAFVLRPWAGFVLAGVSMASFSTLSTIHSSDRALDLQMAGGLLGVAIISWVGASYLEWTASALHTTTDDLERDRITLREAEEKRQQVELALHATEQQSKALFEKSPAGIVLFDNDMTITDCNEKLASQMNSSREELIGTDGGSITSGEWREAIGEALRGRVGSVEGPGPPPAPAETWYGLTASPLRGPAGEILGGVAVVTDLTDRKQAEELVERFAFYDPLTALPNRKLFLDRLLQAVEKLARSGQQVSVAVIDLDHFKDINDLIGHTAADRLLKEIVARVSPLIRRGDTFARMGSDEFALLIPNSRQLSSVVAMADRLLDAFREPWEVGDEQVRVTASIGFATYPDDTEDAQSLLKSADTAMRRAKDLGRDSCQFFDQTMNIKVAKRLRVERELRAALEQEQLVVYYQPQIDLGSGRIVAAEALVRWQHPERGLVAPLDFVPLAEEVGLIGSIDSYVMATACREAAAWRSDCGEAARLAVNISPRHLHSPDFLTQIGGAIVDSGLPAEDLEIELTETAILADASLATSVLTQLRELGVTVALDDFGTGYSSLSHLHKLPIGTVKIDRSFVSRVETDAHAGAIVRAVTDLGHSLGLRVVGEGIETVGQLRLLKHLGCDEGQGYLFAKPLPAAEFRSLLVAERGFSMMAALL